MAIDDYIDTDSLKNLADRYDLKTALHNEVRKRLKRITVQSSYFPDIVLDDPLQPGPPSPALQRIRPKISIQMKGAKDIVIAPYGEPEPTKWPIIKTVGLGITSFIGLGLLNKLR